MAVYGVEYEIGARTYHGELGIVSYVEGVRVRIGRYCCVGRWLKILIGGHAYTKVSCFPFLGEVTCKGDIEVGNDVWLGEGVTLFDGCKIGHGAVIGAASVLRRPVEPYSIWRGNPATLVGYRFPEADRAKLLEIAWWDWPFEEVAAVGHLLNGDLAGFYEYVEARKRGQLLQDTSNARRETVLLP